MISLGSPGPAPTSRRPAPGRRRAALAEQARAQPRRAARRRGPRGRAPRPRRGRGPRRPPARARTPRSGRNGRVCSRTCRRTAGPRPIPRRTRRRAAAGAARERGRRAAGGDRQDELAAADDRSAPPVAIGDVVHDVHQDAARRAPRARSRLVRRGRVRPATHRNAPSRSSGRHAGARQSRPSSASSVVEARRGPSAMTEHVVDAGGEQASTLPSRTASSPITTHARPASSRNTG